LYKNPNLLGEEETISQIFKQEEHKNADLIKRTRFGKLDIIPSNILLFGIETHLENFGEKRLRLKQYLERYAQYFDYVLIDTPPNLGIFLVNSLYASDYILIPTDMEPLAVRGISDLSGTIKRVQKDREKLGEELEILGILPNKLDLRQKIHSEILEEMKEALGKVVLDELAIGINSQLIRAVRKDQVISEYDKSARSYRQFRKLSKWLIERLSDE
jgi:chromosome partitioning protein